tara:strand:+ start:419 stop:652 length:234 start_codon:yes stop_codon:yes gene_type:complete
MNCAKRKPDGYKDDEYICDVWTIDDVFEMAKMNHPDVKLSDDQAKNILRMMQKHHDAENGLTYDTLAYWTEQEIKDA